MKTAAPITFGIILSLLAIPTVIGCFFLLMLAGWGLCGDAVTCDPSVKTVLTIAGVACIIIFAAAGFVLAPICNFILVSILHKKTDIVVPQSYYWTTYSLVAAYVLSLAYVVIPRLLGDVFIFVPLAFTVVSLVSGIVFLFAKRKIALD